MVPARTARASRLSFRALASIALAALVGVGPALSAGGAKREPPAVASAAGPTLPPIVYAVRGPGHDPHWYANFGYWSSDPDKMMYGVDGGRLERLDPATGRVEVLVGDEHGSIRDPAIDFAARRIVFAWRRGGTRNYNLWTVGVDGEDPRPLTTGPWDDIEPVWLPRGDIVFCSSRCRRWVACWHTQVAILHRVRADGTGLHPISSNNEHDNTPAVLSDGRLLYTRWEYIDRNQVTFHHLWSANPDGTGQMVFYGNQHPGTVMIDATVVPDSGAVAAIFSPGHGRTEHVGRLMRVDPRSGPDDRGRAVPVPGAPNNVRDPCALGRGRFLLARRAELLLVDAPRSSHRVLHTLGPRDRQRGLEIHEPIAISPRRTPPAIPSRIDLAEPTGRLVLQDVHVGRNMEGVRPGEIEKLLVVESLPKPVNFSGGPDVISWLGTFTLERALGTVPVEPDGSAYLELPAGRPIFFVALDHQGRSVMRMQSFVSLMPGETTSCVGCHEPRTRAPSSGSRPVVAALEREPSRIEPFEGAPDVIDFPRDIQPILDRHCVRCHDHDHREGKVVLCGDLGMTFSHSYWTIIANNLVADGANGYGNRPPRSIGSSASRLLEYTGGSHHEARLDEHEQLLLWLWIETGATYAGTYAALGFARAPPGPALLAAAGVLERRCRKCHPAAGGGQPGKPPLPAAPGHGPSYSRLFRQNDPAARLSLEILFDLTRPDRSPILLGPLARDAGGYGSCRGEEGDETAAVFRDRSDPDYRAILAGVREMAATPPARLRFELPGFRPNEHYVREMKRFGILAAAFDPTRDPIDVYETDRRYWRSLWPRPAPGDRSSPR